MPAGTGDAQADGSTAGVLAREPALSDCWQAARRATHNAVYSREHGRRTVEGHPMHSQPRHGWYGRTAPGWAGGRTTQPLRSTASHSVGTSHKREFSPNTYALADSNPLTLRLCRYKTRRGVSVWVHGRSTGRIPHRWRPPRHRQPCGRPVREQTTLGGLDHEPHPATPRSCTTDQDARSNRPSRRRRVRRRLAQHPRSQPLPSAIGRA